MRRNPQPSRHQTADSRPRKLEPPTRKVFNCIVDDTALVAGVKKSTRDGIRKWISNGAIRLFVPLHTLTQLDRLKKGNQKIHADAREAIKWLDDITSMPGIQNVGLVQLQGVDEEYSKWEEVEKYLLPETLLSMDDIEHDLESLGSELESSLTLQDDSDEASLSSSLSTDLRPKTPSSPMSAYSSTSPEILHTTLYKPEDPGTITPSTRVGRYSGEYPPGDKSAVPPFVRPLFNYILWRVNREHTTESGLQTFIFLTNDAAKQTIAQRFGIRVKRLEQLRDAVAREERDYRNRLTFFEKETGTRVTPDKEQPKSVDDAVEVAVGDSVSDNEDAVAPKRTPKVSNSPRTPPKQPNQRLFDPNEFSRTPPTNNSRGGGGGGGGGRGGRGSRGNFRGPYRGSGHGRGSPRHQAPAPPADPNQPIDPESFSRPSTGGRSLRGGRRRLWEPT